MAPRKLLAAALLIAACAGLNAQNSSPAQRPQITGISHLAVYAAGAAQSQNFYVETVGLTKAADPENKAGSCYYVNGRQYVEVLPLPDQSSPNRLDHIAFQTTDAEALRRYLGAHGVTVPERVESAPDGSQRFKVLDPLGNRIEFVEGGAGPQMANAPGKVPLGKKIIHVGTVVRDPAAADHFYRELLGFRPYWKGGMQEGKTDFISLQVPNGTDWLEYMLTIGPSSSGVSASPTQHELGVKNHLSIGVPNVAAVVPVLEQRGWKPSAPGDGPKIGRDGKWQLNIYDPDGTRVELMSFRPAKEPCCSPFTGPHPSEE